MDFFLDVISLPEYWYLVQSRITWYSVLYQYLLVPLPVLPVPVERYGSTRTVPVQYLYQVQYWLLVLYSSTVPVHRYDGTVPVGRCDKYEYKYKYRWRTVAREMKPSHGMHRLSSSSWRRRSSWWSRRGPGITVPLGLLTTKPLLLPWLDCELYLWRVHLKNLESSLLQIQLQPWRTSQHFSAPVLWQVSPSFECEITMVGLNLRGCRAVDGRTFPVRFVRECDLHSNATHPCFSHFLNFACVMVLVRIRPTGRTNHQGV